MGLFKSKDERRIEREMKIRGGIKEDEGFAEADRAVRRRAAPADGEV